MRSSSYATLKLMGHIDVIIKQHIDGYIAESPMFPNCLGHGKTERTALRRLATQIGKTIGQTSQALFKELLTSDNYTHLILNSSLAADDSGENKRVYPLYNQHQAMVKMAEINLPSLDASYPNILLVNCDETKQSQPKRYQHSLSSHEASHDDDDPQGYSFGFPISFN